MEGAVTSEIKKKELESPGGKEESVVESTFWLERCQILSMEGLSTGD